MFATSKMMSPAAAAAAGLVALATLVGCAFGGTGHSHGHGAVTPGSTHAEPEAETEEEHPAGHDHGAAEAPAAGGEQEAHGTAGAEPHGGSHSGHGRGTASPGTRRPEARGTTGHAGHLPLPGGVTQAPAAPTPEAPSPGQPAETLRPDALDAPAASSLLDAQRSAEMAQGMASEGHSSHGGGMYRHVDVGREPGAAPATPSPSSREGEHEHASGVAESAVVVYACPMHPEVTSETPGICPKCRMTLVQRRKG